MAISQIWTGIFLLVLPSLVLSLSPITSYGSKFFKADGSQWFIKGTKYGAFPSFSNYAQVTGGPANGTDLGYFFPVIEHMTNGSQCELDATIMVEFGINAIKVDQLNTTNNHKACVEVFDRSGIFIFVALDADVVGSIGVTNNSDGATLLYTWNDYTFSQYKKVMDEFSLYNNTAGYFIQAWSSDRYEPSDGTLPTVRAAVSDIKSYAATKKYRPVPVGVEVPQSDPVVWSYLSCRDDQIASMPSIDFLGIAGLAGDIATGNTGFNLLENSSVPVFYSYVFPDFAIPDPWSGLDAVYNDGPIGESLSSGAIVGEFSPFTGQNDSLVDYSDPRKFYDSGVQVTLITSLSRTATIHWEYSYYGGTPTAQPFFSSLSAHWKTLSPTGISACNYTPSYQQIECQAATISVTILTSYLSTYTTITTSLIQTAAASGGGSVFAAGSATVSVTSSQNQMLMPYTLLPPTAFPTLTSPILTSTTKPSFAKSCVPAPAASSSALKIGLAVGLSALAVIIATIAAILVRKHKKRRLANRVITSKQELPPYVVEKAELDTVNSTGKSPGSADVGLFPGGYHANHAVHEMNVDPAELDGSNVPAELGEHHGLSEIAEVDEDAGAKSKRGSWYERVLRKPIPAE